MKRITGSLKLLAATMIMVLFAALFFVMTVAGRTALDREEREAYYRQQEKDMVRNVRSFLEEQGLENSGIMLTYVEEENGFREYTLTVHHGDIDRMDGNEQELLAARRSSLLRMRIAALDRDFSIIEMTNFFSVA